MHIIVNVYGAANSYAPDIKYTYVINEHMEDGKWTNTVSLTRHEFFGELIDELDEKQVETEVKNCVEAVLNSDRARAFVSNPSVRLYYDDESKAPVAKII